MNGRDEMQSSGTRRQPPMDAKSRLREFVETAKRMKTERATAEEVVRQLLRNTPVAEWPQLADREELRNSGALERLGCESRDLLERKPQEALAIAELATTIADSLPEDTYPAAVLAQVRAGAWKDRANALRYVSRPDEAYQAISRAEKTLMGHSALVVDRAVVDLVKAMVVWELGDCITAHELLANAEEVFAAVGDSTHMQHARLINAGVLYKEERFAEARTAYEALMQSAREANNSEMVARLHNNLGHCKTHLGDYASANVHFSDAIALFTDLGFRAEAIRTQRGAGQLLVEKGQKTSGIAHLKAARSAFMEFGMVRDAALCGLRMAEAFLADGEVDAARAVTRDIARDFIEARFSNESIDMLFGLEQTIAAKSASPESIRNVHGFIATVAEHVA